MTVEAFENIAPKRARGVYIDKDARVVGDVTIAEDSSVWPFTVARGDVNRIDIGARTNVQDNSVLHVTHDGPYSPGGFALTIGDEVTIGHRVILHACTVGNRCLIGMGAIVMDGAVIEDEVLLAAGSLVTPGKRLKRGCLYRGQPAVEVRPLSTKEREMLRYSAEHYVRLKNRYAAG